MILLGMVLLITGGCREDLALSSGADREAEVTLMVPAAPRFTSGSSYATAEELKYSSLVFFAFPTDNSAESSGKIYAERLSANPDNLNVVDAYRQYSIKLQKGTYRFYLIANYFGINDELPASEEALKARMLEYDSNFTGAMPAAGLPMSADNTDFRYETSSGSKGSVGAGGFEYDGKGVELYADLTFACAKVTLTAKDFKGDIAEISDIKLNQLSANVPVIFKAGNTGYGMVSLSSITPFMEDGDNGAASADGNDAESGGETSDSKSVTFYVPERYVASGSEGEQSYLTFKAGEKDVVLPLGEAPGTEANPTGDVLQVPGMEEMREIHRGTHYIYELNALLEASLRIEEWSPVQIAYELRGPVYLHVEKQAYEVKAGEETAIWYDSDVENVFVKSPKYTDSEGNTLDLYTYSINEARDSIYLTVNRDIKSSEYPKILAEKEKYNYFHIVAGPINKRIEVTPLSLEHYLYVSPAEIPIDVRMRIASGDYEGTVPVRIITNYPSIKIERGDGWESLPDGEWGTTIAADSRIIGLVNGNGTFVDLEGYDGEANEKSIDLSVLFKGLNSGKQTWKQARQLTFTVTGMDDGQSESVPITINIYPNVMNYKIHFHADGWVNPHIYVYQCLEFPADWRGMYGTTPLASKPIGFKDNNSWMASLEYSFTGKIAFLGWDNPVNRDVLYDAEGNVNSVDVRPDRGFYIFNQDTESWRPDYKTTPQVYRYTYDMDFCAEHRDKIKELCSACNSEEYKTDANPNGYNKVFPGIQMIKEDDDWWYFELTGVATPGRSLIMFADGHLGDLGRQFPAKDPNPTIADAAPVGLPLFDNPNQEAWLWFNGEGADRMNNVFTAEVPSKKYRLYWPKSTGMERVWIWLLNGDGAFLRNITPGEWQDRNMGVTFNEDDEYYHYDFEETPNPSNLYLMFSIRLDDGSLYGGPKVEFSSKWNLKTFTLGSDGYRSAYLVKPINGEYKNGDPGELKSGKPTE